MVFLSFMAVFPLLMLVCSMVFSNLDRNRVWPREMMKIPSAHSVLLFLLLITNCCFLLSLPSNRKYRLVLSVEISFCGDELVQNFWNIAHTTQGNSLQLTSSHQLSVHLPILTCSPKSD